ncbi:MAG: RloB family protein, partial [Salinivirgaceae bacterium]|nr:RloB family protein [Salinivirgaceae bacterium]
GEGITEQYYLSHLKDLKGYKYSIRPKLFQNIDIENAESIIEELLTGGCDSIIFLTDYDTIIGQNKKNAFNNLVEKFKNKEEVLICESMPSIEYWFLLHFIFATREFTKCEKVIVELKKYLKDYNKKANYLQTEKWFNNLNQNGGLEKAIANANMGLERYKTEEVGIHFPFTKIHLAIQEFEKQKNNK